METEFIITESNSADAGAIASLFALSWASPFMRLQFGRIDPEDLVLSMIPRIIQKMSTKGSKFVIARLRKTGEVAAVAQWALPVAEMDARNEESREDRDERQRFEDEAYRQSLPISCNIDLVMAFTLGLRRLREETLQARQHFLLENLATHWSHRGKGLASELVQWVFPLADAQGVLVYLDTASDNPAARLYKRLGFEEQGSNTIEKLTRYAPIDSIEELGCDTKHTHIAFLRFPRSFSKEIP